jgi:inhibitor of cysteine peptidase
MREQEQREHFSKDIENKIKESAKKVTVPEGLTPKKMKEVLREKKVKKKIPKFYKIASAAACLGIVILGSAIAFWPSGRKEISEVSSAQNDTISGIQALSYEEVFRRVPGFRGESSIFSFLSGNNQVRTVEEAEMASDLSTGPGAAVDSTAKETVDFSETNLQEFGVDEADIVKTDGKNIYVVNTKRNAVKIVAADRENLTLVQSIDVSSSNESIEEIYVRNNKLTVITTLEESEIEEETQEENVYIVKDREVVQVYTYEIDGENEAVLKGKIKQDGSYLSSRFIEDDFYLFTNYEPENPKKKDPFSYIPRVEDELIPYDHIYIPMNHESAEYIVISSMNQGNPDKIIDSKAIVSGTSDYYISPKNVYFTTRNYKGKTSKTQIVKLELKKGDIQASQVGKVEGTLNDSFSLNEYKGNLRVVTTVDSEDERYNNLYILDEKLKPISTIKNIAKNESIQSARFMGDMGYFVTFRNVDPLFSVDLSNPEKPKILGELKVTGFSSYLHFFGDYGLLGVGYEADEDTGMREGIKLSMFDISNPANVTEKHKLVYSDVWENSVLYNYKDVFLDPARGLIGFSSNGEFKIVSYSSEDGFMEKITLNYQQLASEAKEDLQRDAVNETGKGLYIEDTFYLVVSDSIYAYEMSGFTQLSNLNLQ